MIGPADINTRSREWGVRLEIVEKDYVIGWLLWGIGADPVLGNAWVFKGGTCLKKCYIETYRFSEDLDFTVMPDGPVEPQVIEDRIRHVLDRVSEASGIEFNSMPPKLRSRPGGDATEGRVYYRGPLHTPSPASIKLDLSRSEAVVRPTILRAISHPYPDTLPAPDHVRCYAFEELFAEKIRAMGERSRPRDLYDIVNLFRRQDLHRHGDLIAEVLADKCTAKGIPTPTLDSIAASPYRDQLRSEWHNMLDHQLPVPLNFGQFWEELPGLFDWLGGRSTTVDVQSIKFAPDEDQSWTPPPTAWVWGQRTPFEPIRFAASNRLCIELGYGGGIRIVEPYSLRRTRDGNLLLYGLKLPHGELRSYRVDRIESVRVTTTPFTPKFAVELSVGSPLSALPTRRTGTHHYIVECLMCHRQFSRTKPDMELRKHRDAAGGWCGGRRGRMVP